MYIRTSNFIRAFRSHSFEVELSDLRFLTCGEGERGALGVRYDGELLGWRGGI